MNKLNELLDQFAKSSEQYAISWTSSWYAIRKCAREFIIDYVEKIERERDEALKAQNRSARLNWDLNERIKKADERLGDAEATASDLLDQCAVLRSEYRTVVANSDNNLDRIKVLKARAETAEREREQLDIAVQVLADKCSYLDECKDLSKWMQEAAERRARIWKCAAKEERKKMHLAVSLVNEVQEERDELREENAKFRNLIEESNKYFLSIDDKARASGLTYDAVRDIVHNYLTDEEEKQISFGKVVEELRSLCRVCAEDMTKEKSK